MMKVVIFLVTALGNIGIGIILFFFLLLSLNGYSEKQAEAGLILFIIWVLFFSAAAVCAVLSASFLTIKKSLNWIAASLVSILIFVVIGAILNFVGTVAAIVLTEALR
jgi:hypothetical protein